MMKINRAAYKDLKEILALQKIAYQQEAAIYNDFTIEPLVQTIDGINEELEIGVILVAFEDNCIVGSVRAFEKGDTCYIGKLIVRPEYQNKGLGQKLLISIENEFNEVSRFELFTGHRSEKNLYLYAKNGYREVRRKKANDAFSLVYLEKQKS